MIKDMDNAILDYFQQYRIKKQEAEDIAGQLEMCEKNLAVLRAKQQEVANELNSMKRIITTMVDYDCDPVEAKLKYDNTVVQSMWDSNLSGTEIVPTILTVDTRNVWTSLTNTIK